MASKQTELVTTKKVLENAKFAKAGTDKTVSLYYWLEAENAYDEAKDTVESLESEIETLTDTIGNQQKEIETLTYNLSSAKKALESGKVEAQATYDINIYKYNNAKEIYDTSIEDSTLKQKIAQTDYDDAKSKLDDVSVTITIDEDEKEKIEEGTMANVTIAALEDEVFSGEVTKISDATYDSDTGKNNYDITINITCNTEKVFDGMSAEATLITKKMQEVLYVSNRAIIRDGTKSYVKVKADNNIKKVEVETGFSDGINVEITKGLSEDEVVLVESKVSR